MLEQTINQIYDVAISENKLCVYEGLSAENIPNYEADFLDAATRAIRDNPQIAEIDLVGMSDFTIQSLIPSIATLANLQRLALNFNYITAHTSEALAVAARNLPINSFSILENEFLTDQNRCPVNIAIALLNLSQEVEINLYRVEEIDVGIDIASYDIPPLSHEAQRVKLMADSAWHDNAALLGE